MQARGPSPGREEWLGSLDSKAGPPCSIRFERERGNFWRPIAACAANSHWGTQRWRANAHTHIKSLERYRAVASVSSHHVTGLAYTHPPCRRFWSPTVSRLPPNRLIPHPPLPHSTGTMLPPSPTTSTAAEAAAAVAACEYDRRRPLFDGTLPVELVAAARAGGTRERQPLTLRVLRGTRARGERVLRLEVRVATKMPCQLGSVGGPCECERDVCGAMCACT